MGEAEMGSLLKQKLKSLCCSNGWSYGVFWRFDQRNPMLLTIGDAYYGEQMESVADNMLLKFHLLGVGIVGQVAFNGKHQWIFPDSHGDKNCSSVGSIGDQNLFQNESEFQSQYSSGIKTIAIIPVEPQGVVQFGSTQKILEKFELLDQAKKLFSGVEGADRLIPLEDFPSSLGSDYDLNTFSPFLLSASNSYIGNLLSEQVGSSGELRGEQCSQTNPTESSTFVPQIQQNQIGHAEQNSSSISSQLPTICTEAQAILSSTLNTQFQHATLQSTSYANNTSADDFIFTSFELSLPSEWEMWDSQFDFVTNKDNLLGITEQDFQVDSTFSSFISTGELVDQEKPICLSGTSVNNQQSAALTILTDGVIMDSLSSLPTIIPEESRPAKFTTASNFSAVDDFSQFFISPTKHSINEVKTTITGDLSCPRDVSVKSLSVGGDAIIGIPVTRPTNSVQSSITDTFISNGEEKFMIGNGAGNDFLDGVDLDFVFENTAGECLEDISMPALSACHSAISTGKSGCSSEIDVGTFAGSSQRRLFSKLGLEELLDSVSSSNSVTNTSVEDRIPTSKRRKMESSSSNFNQVQFVGHSFSNGGINLMQQPYNWDMGNNTMLKKEFAPKSQVGLWIDDSYSINARNDFGSTPKKPEPSPKPARKRPRPGESTRPRPKDRQMIQDRIKELRKIIPHRGKCPIDTLLDNTIKYLLFLQGITKNADQLTQPDEPPKLTGQENKSLRKENEDGGCASFVEVGDQSMVCPVIVEDLNPPGQILIEMLCEDRGFFLEIADTIRGFGLNILKGVMEMQEDKIWSRFIVEANKQVTRLEILWSLMQLVQQPDTTGISPTNQPSRTMNGGVSLLNNQQQPSLVPPVPSVII